MMSRITIHLRKQARSRGVDTQLQTFSFATRTVTSGVRSLLRFTRPTAAMQESVMEPRVAVTVEESIMTHDDSGNVLDEVDDHDAEWFEMRPPAAVRLATFRSVRRTAEEPGLKFVV